MKLGDYVRLWQVSRRRLRSERDYREFQAFQARQILNYLAAHGVVLCGRSLLDLGSGIGGYSQEFVRQGARVIGVDLVQPHLPHTVGMSQVQATASAIPLRNGAVDVVFCASLIEHVAEPQIVLAEIERVLTAGGVCYVSFPPYYSPVGGHEFAPFHYLGERLALRLAKRRAAVPEWLRQLYDIPTQVQSFADSYPGWGLYKMTIRKFRRLVAHTGLVRLDMSTRYMPISCVGWPLLGEILTWHAQFLLAKPPVATP